MPQNDTLSSAMQAGLEAVRRMRPDAADSSAAPLDPRPFSANPVRDFLLACLACAVSGGIVGTLVGLAFGWLLWR